MTIQQAMQRGLTRVRLPAWNPEAYLELARLPDGTYGPWGRLYDPPCNAADVGVPAGHGVPVMYLGETDWEEFIP